MGDIFKRGNFDYVKTTNQTIDVNPGFVGATWLNLTTGEVFVAIQLLSDGSVWRGQLNSWIFPDSFIPGCVTHYTMGNIVGSTLYDETGTANGTISGATQVDGYLGKALSFDGIDDGITFANLGIFGGDFTAVAWVEFDQIYTALSDNESIFSFSGEKSISLLRDQTTGKFRVLAYDGTVFDVYSTTIPTPGTLYHVALRWDMGTKFEIIVNAAIEGTNTTSRTPNATAVTNSIGYRADGPDRYLDGALDEVRIYNRALSAAEISILYNEAA